MIDFQPEPEFKLSPGERSTALWMRLKGELDRRLQKARERNDGSLPPDQTAHLRGEISCLKRLLALGQDEPPPTID